MKKHIIFGSGDVGRRIIEALRAGGTPENEILPFVRSASSAKLNKAMNALPLKIDLDAINESMTAALRQCHNSFLYYTVPPQNCGEKDQRSRALVKLFSTNHIYPNKLVLLSTTGVYAPSDKEWTDEATAAEPVTERGKRRLDSEQVWHAFAKQYNVRIVILRVPAIYARSRLSLERFNRRTPVVQAQDSGYTNRIHADDLAQVCVTAMLNDDVDEVYNVTDGNPTKTVEFFRAAADLLGMSPLPEISMEEARNLLSDTQLSYLAESRKISNRKMLRQLSVKLRYPDFKDGLKH